MAGKAGPMAARKKGMEFIELLLLGVIVRRENSPSH